MLAIIGESGCGKSSTASYINNNFGLKNIVGYTTRPIRKNETDGADYHFISEKDFAVRRNKGFFAKLTEYNGWKYGTAKDDFENPESKIIILSPKEMRRLKRNGIKLYTVYISIPRRDRMIRLLQRGDDIEEIYRRNLTDIGQFDGIEDEADLIINNDGYKKSVRNIAEGKVKP